MNREEGRRGKNKKNRNEVVRERSRKSSGKECKRHK